jgi:hypothetical protein
MREEILRFVADSHYYRIYASFDGPIAEVYDEDPVYRPWQTFLGFEDPDDSLDFGDMVLVVLATVVGVENA